MKSIFSSREAILSAAILIALGLIATRFPAFIEPKKLLAVFNDTSPLIILAIGQMIVILTKCIDLSVAANLALSDDRCDDKWHGARSSDCHLDFDCNRNWNFFGGAERPSCLEIKHSINRGDIGHHDHFQGHYICYFRWEMGQCA